MNIFSRIVTGVSIAIIASVTLVSCFTNPITGRKGINLIDAGTVNSMAATQYSQFLSQHRTNNNSAEGKMVKKVGDRIANAVSQYLNSKGQGDLLKGFKWEFNYVESKEVNAWCMPGGKVVVYSGIMPIAKDETGLAVVMGHEIAHAIAQHGNERMSQGLIQQLGGVGLSIALRDKPQQTQQLFNTAYGVGTTVGGTLPFSRKHETEADEMGMIFMAMAGYDPNAAAPFWERMNALNKGQQPPEILSTHPNSSTRSQNLKKFVPQAMKYYKPIK